MANAILLPGDPGWVAPKRPAFFDSAEAFAKEWDRVKAQEPEIDVRMQRVRQKNPLANPHKLIGGETTSHKPVPGLRRLPR